MIIEAAVIIAIIEVAILAASRGEIQVSSALKHETDLRLPYKQYKKIYPKSTLTYEAYKMFQARNAFQSTVPSKMIKRMVH